MAITWDIRTELINKDTQLRKVVATRTDSEKVQTFFVKARMKTTAEKDAVWNNIRQQYLNSVKIVDDVVAASGKSYLNAKEIT